MRFQLPGSMKLPAPVRVSTSRVVEHGMLWQEVELHRVGVAPGRAYARCLPLPSEPAARRRLYAAAAVVLDLVAGAVLATERARECRSAALEQVDGVGKRPGLTGRRVA